MKPTGHPPRRRALQLAPSSDSDEAPHPPPTPLPSRCSSRGSSPLLCVSVVPPKRPVRVTPLSVEATIPPWRQAWSFLVSPNFDLPWCAADDGRCSVTKRASHKNLDPLVQRGVVNSTVHSTIRAALARFVPMSSRRRSDADMHLSVRSKYARNAENYLSNTGTKMSSGPRDLLLQTSSSDLELRPILRFEPFYAASAAMNAGRFLKINKGKAAKARNSVDYEGNGSLWRSVVAQVTW